MFEDKSGAYPSEEHFRCSTLGKPYQKTYIINIMTLNIMNLHIMTLSITIKRWHKCSVECHNYAMLNVIRQSVFMLSVVMQSVVMLSVLAPFERNKSR
jgi:hypothetical protein